MPTELNIWTPDGIIPVGDGNAAYDAGNSGIYSASAINTNSPGHPSFNSNTPVVNIPDQVIGGGSQFGPLLPANPHGGEPKIGNYSTGTFTPTAAMISNQANTNKYPLNDYSADDRFRTDGGMQPNRGVTPDSTAPNTSPSGGGGRAQSTGPAPIPQVLLSQNLTQRPQTGNIYAPDLSAYNDSSLFNYTGPGGVDEYTYGQGLPYEGAGYDIWGSPTDIANPYYEGQFAPQIVGDGGFPATQITQPGPVGPADGAINMNPVQLPSDLPQIEVSADVSMPGFVGGGNQTIGGSLPTDLTYQQTIDEMGIFGPDNPPPSTTFPSPGESNLSLAERQAQQMGTANWDAMVAQADAMDKQLREGQLSSYDPYKGEAELNKDVGKLGTLPLGANTPEENEILSALIRNDGSEVTIPFGTSTMPELGTPNPQSGLPVPEFNTLPEQGLTPLQQAARDAAGNIDTRDFRFNPTGEEDKSLLQKWVEDGPAYQPTSDAAIAEMEAMGKQVKEYADKASLIRNMGVEPDNLFDEHFDRNQAEYTPTLSDYYPNATPMQFAKTAGGDGFTPKIGPKTGPSGLTAYDTISDGDSENIFQTQDVEADAYQRALDKERYQTQINNPTADFSGYMKNYGSGFKEPQASLSDVTDATPMQFANSASQMEVANTNIFNEKRDNSIFAKGPSETSTEIKSVFDEQQNYEVPASEMSPGETGLINGIVEGLQAFGPNDIRTTGEQNAWNEYNSYKDAGIKALNNGEIDEKAFNEIKGKAGSETVVNHFVDSSKNPKINNFMTNASNIFYQAMDVIVGDDSIKDGIVDYYQQKKGVNSSVPLGSVAEEIAKAKEATQQRKEVQENIFTPGPMKFAAAASSPKPVVVKKDKPSRKPVKTTTSVVKTSKPSRTPTKKTTSKPNYGYTRTYSRRYGL